MSQEWTFQKFNFALVINPKIREGTKRMSSPSRQRMRRQMAARMQRRHLARMKRHSLTMQRKLERWFDHIIMDANPQFVSLGWEEAAP